MDQAAPRPDLLGDVRRGLGWSVLNNTLLRMGSFLLGVVLARLLLPEQFGTYAVALTVQAVLMTLADFGLSADLVRSDQPERIAPTIASMGLVTGSALCLVMAASAHGLASMLGSPGAAGAITLLSLTLLLAGVGVVPYADLLRGFRQKALFAVMATDFAVSTTITLALLAAGWGVMALAAGRVTAQVVSLALQFRLSGRRPHFGYDRTVIRPVLGFGLPVAGANLLSWALLNLDNVVIARAAGPIALGYYVLAFNIASWPMSVIGQVVRSVALPGFARARAAGLSGPRVGSEDALAVSTALSWVLGLLVGIMLAALAGPVVTVLYGARWSLSAPVVAALGLFGGLRVVFDLFVGYLTAHGATRHVLAVQVLWFAALLPAMVVGTARYGIVGGGWAHLVVAVLVILPAYAVCLSRIGTPIRPLLRACWRPSLALAPAGLAAALVSSQIHNAALALLGGGLVGLAVFTVAALGWLRGVVALTVGTGRLPASVQPQPGGAP